MVLKETKESLAMTDHLNEFQPQIMVKSCYHEVQTLRVILENANQSVMLENIQGLSGVRRKGEVEGRIRKVMRTLLSLTGQARYVTMLVGFDRRRSKPITRSA